MIRDVVTTSNDDHPALASALERELVKEVNVRTEALIAAKDWPDFERRRGEIMGLQAAISICGNVDKRLKA